MKNYKYLDEFEKERALSNEALFKFYKHNKTIKDKTISGLYSLDNEIFEIIVEYFKTINYSYGLKGLFEEVVQLVEAYIHGNRYFNGWVYNLNRETLKTIKEKLDKFIERYNILFEDEGGIDGKI